MALLNIVGILAECANGKVNIIAELRYHKC